MTNGPFSTPSRFFVYSFEPQHISCRLPQSIQRCPFGMPHAIAFNWFSHQIHKMTFQSISKLNAISEESDFISCVRIVVTVYLNVYVFTSLVIIHRPVFTAYEWCLPCRRYDFMSDFITFFHNRYHAVALKGYRHSKSKKITLRLHNMCDLLYYFSGHSHRIAITVYSNRESSQNLSVWIDSISMANWKYQDLDATSVPYLHLHLAAISLTSKRRNSRCERMKWQFV